MSDVRAVKVREGVFSLYDQTGDFVGRVNTDTGRAIIGDAFYGRVRTCTLDYDAVHLDYVCSRCGERYESDLYAAMTDDDRTILRPMWYCPNCGARVIG